MMPPADPFLEPKPQAASGSSDGWAWMVIFTDLISLMLTFFVLLFSMSNLQLDRWENLIDVLSRTLSPNYQRRFAGKAPRRTRFWPGPNWSAARTGC